VSHRELRPRFPLTKPSYRLGQMPEREGELRSFVLGLRSSESDLHSVSFFTQPLS